MCLQLAAQEPTHVSAHQPELVGDSSKKKELEVLEGEQEV